jgi:hypothetical protein
MLERHRHRTPLRIATVVSFELPKAKQEFLLYPFPL